MKIDSLFHIIKIINFSKNNKIIKLHFMSDERQDWFYVKITSLLLDIVLENKIWLILLWLYKLNYKWFLNKTILINRKENYLKIKMQWIYLD